MEVGNPTSGSVPVEMTNWKRSNLTSNSDGAHHQPGLTSSSDGGHHQPGLTSSSDGAHHQPGLVLQAFNGGGGSKQPVSFFSCKSRRILFGIT